MKLARGRLKFKQADVTRAIKAARAASLEVARVEIEPATGKIVIIAGKPEPSAEPNEWDEVLQDAATEKGDVNDSSQEQRLLR